MLKILTKIHFSHQFWLNEIFSLISQVFGARIIPDVVDS